MTTANNTNVTIKTTSLERIKVTIKNVKCGHSTTCDLATHVRKDCRINAHG